jgi:hypothetical protein
VRDGGAMTDQKPPALLLGPMLRHVDSTTATVWVETTHNATVEVRSHGRTASTRTFTVEGHHFALVLLEGLRAATEATYDVVMDGKVVWPLAEDPLPAPVIRTLPDHDQTPTHDLDIVFGSCRVDRPHESPWNLAPEDHPDGVGVDALSSLSNDCQTKRRRLPDLLLMLGDQVYADEGLSPRVRERQIERRGEHSEPTDEVFDFEEYTWLYRDSWSDPDVRWLLSTVPTAMVFDDHDVRDDWNTSEAWREEVRRLPWWPDRIVGAYMSYWVYQHLGNLSPDVLAHDGLLAKVVDAEDGGAVLRAFAERAANDVDGQHESLWSYVRDLGRARLVVIDTRSGRILHHGQRSMLGEGEWQAIEDWLRGDVEHLLVASSLPLILDHLLHDVEQWNEALAGGSWGSRVARLGEKLRQGADLEHWAAFPESFTRLVTRLGEVAEGKHGSAPSTVLVLSGDVHHSYVAPVTYPGDNSGADAGRSPVVQVTSSPMRNAFPRSVQRAFRMAHTGPARRFGAFLRRTVRLAPPPVDWWLSTGPLYGNGVGSLRISGDTMVVRLERAELRGDKGTLLVRHEEQICGRPGVGAAG